MNRIDVVLAIVLTLFAVRGFWRGFSREFFGFIGLIGGLAVAAAAYPAAIPYLPESIQERLRPIVAFAALFFAIDVTANILGAVVHRLLGVLFLSPVNRLAGALFGVAKGAAMATIALMLARAYTPAPALMSELEASRLARPLLGLAGDLDGDRHRSGARAAGAHDDAPPSAERGAPRSAGGE